MKNTKLHIQKMICLLLSVQIFLFSICMPLFKYATTEARYLITICGPVQQKSVPSDPKNIDLTDFEDEAEDQDNASFTEKTIDFIFSADKEWADQYIVFTKFVQYNLQERVQFHPEFTTPPPKIATL